MKLSQLVYECVRDSVSYPNQNFTYDAFKDKSFVETKDYANQFAEVFSALNLAFSRLEDSNKVPYKVEKNVPVNQGYVSFDKGRVINFAILRNKSYERIEFRTLEQNNEYLLMSEYDLSNVSVEYLPELPHILSWDEMEEIDGDLKEKWGINNVMVSYIKEFVKGQLYEIISPDIANLHNNRAEQYFADIKKSNTNFYQNKVKNTWKGFWL